MFNIVLDRSDCIESVLPVVERAMAAGAVCRLQNIAQLGPFECVAQSLVEMVDDLLEGVRQCPVQPGFKLLGVDEQGVTHTLLI